MSILESIIKTGVRAPRITLYGRPGIGKSTLASQFPSPLFLLTEEIGLSGIEALPVSTSFKEVWKNAQALFQLGVELPYKTIVIDSLSKLDTLVVNHILADEPAAKSGKPATLNSACGGYGAGTLRAEAIHRGFKALMDGFQELGVGVVYVSHLTTTKIKAPDAEDYDIHTIIMNSEKCRSVYIDDVDMVGFCRLKSFSSETESGRTLIKSTNDRIIVTGVNDSHVSKNRFNMPNEVPMSFEDVAKYIPFYQSKEL